uniref:Uncharacterized protein n=1 Tax=Populus trichocarpa TaxID=3694 RepID=A0A3N7FJD9_POPTR
MFILRVHFGNAVVYAFSKSEATKYIRVLLCSQNGL